MEDRERHDHPNRGEEPLFSNSPEYERRFSRIEQLARAHAILGHALELDNRLRTGVPEGITKKFVNRSGGNQVYPFPHLRVKLRPKNQIESTIKVVALRYPTPGLDAMDFIPDTDRLFLAWETIRGEEQAFVLDVDAFSRLDLIAAFGQPDDQGKWPSLEARTPSDELDQFNLELILNDFEPDLQTRKPDVKA